MYSHHKHRDKELYQEIILLMDSLVPFAQREGENDVPFILDGLSKEAEKLKHKIATHDYTEEDTKHPDV